MEKEIKEKKSKVPVIITIIVCVLFAIIGYFGGDFIASKVSSLEKKSDVKSSDKDETETIKEEKIDINSSLVQNLYNIFKYDACYKDVDSLNNNNLVKLRIAYNNIPKSSVFTIECSKIGTIDGAYCGASMTDLMTDAYSVNDTQKFNEYEMQNHTYAVKADVIENKVYELFGNDYKFKNESFGILDYSADASCHVMNYNSTNNIYAEYNGECGGSCPVFEQKLLSATKKGDKLYIVTNVSEPDQKPTEITYEFEKDKENDNYVFIKATGK